MPRELEPCAPVARLGAGRLDQDVARVVVQVEALQHDAVEVEAIPVEELRKIYETGLISEDTGKWRPAPICISLSSETIL